MKAEYTGVGGKSQLGGLTVLSVIPYAYPKRNIGLKVRNLELKYAVCACFYYVTVLQQFIFVKRRANREERFL